MVKMLNNFGRCVRNIFRSGQQQADDRNSKKNYDRRQSVCAEAYNPDEESDDDEPNVVYPKSDEQRKRLNEAVKDILLFKSLDSEQLNQVLDAMFERKSSKGEHIIDQGGDGDNFYVIDSGKFDILVKDNDGTFKNVGSYDSKGFFGELALMYNTPRAATIVSSGEGILWALDRVIFRKIVLKAAYKRRQMHEALLEKVPMLKHLNEFERMNIADALESCSFQDGETIIKEGDTSTDIMFFIEKGVCMVMKHSKEHGNDVKVNELKEGGYFGELALLTLKPRAATVIPNGPVLLASLDIQAFERLLGPCMNVMKRNIDDYEKQLQSLGLSTKDLRGK